MTSNDCSNADPISTNLPTCLYDASLGMFRLIRECGKILAAGFGVAHRDHKYNRTCNFLFIEEALFLHERGLILVYLSNLQNIPAAFNYPGFKEKIQTPIELLDDPGSDTDNLILLDTQDLYTLMLQELHFPLTVYVTYSHLRSQSYIVVRHFDQRLNIIHQLKQRNNSLQRKRRLLETSSHGYYDYDQDLNNGMTLDPYDIYPSKDNLRVQFRLESFMAQTPHVLNPKSESNHVAFHVYQPSSSYRKTDPGEPDFFAAITYFHEPDCLSFEQIYTLTKSCNGIPLRLATVSDSGTVIMFGITDIGVPDICRPDS